MTVFVVLLRAIGPITHKIMSMAQWRSAVAAAGFKEPETYLATGNMIVEGGGSLPQVTETMNRIVRDLGLAENSRAIVRTPDQIRSVFEANPLPEAASTRPSQMGVYFFAAVNPELGWVQDYKGPEALRVIEQHLIVDYGGRVSESRLLGMVEKWSGTGTARNWNTFRGLVKRSTKRQTGKDFN